MNSLRNLPVTVVTKKGTRWIEDGHVWVYEGEVFSSEPVPGDGDLTDVRSEGGKYLGTGFYNTKTINIT